MSHQPKKTFVRNIFGNIHSAGKTVRETEHGRVMRFKELSKGFCVSVGSPCEKPSFVFTFHPSSPRYSLGRGEKDTRCAELIFARHRASTLMPGNQAGVRRRCPDAGIGRRLEFVCTEETPFLRRAFDTQGQSNRETGTLEIRYSDADERRPSASRFPFCR